MALFKKNTPVDPPVPPAEAAPPVDPEEGKDLDPQDGPQADPEQTDPPVAADGKPPSKPRKPKSKEKPTPTRRNVRVHIPSLRNTQMTQLRASLNRVLVEKAVVTYNDADAMFVIEPVDVKFEDDVYGSAVGALKNFGFPNPEQFVQFKMIGQA